MTDLTRLIELLAAALESGAITVTVTISLDVPTQRHPYIAVCPVCNWTRPYSWESSRDKGLRAHIQRKHGHEQNRAASQQNGRSAE